MAGPGQGKGTSEADNGTQARDDGGVDSGGGSGDGENLTDLKELRSGIN